MNKQKIINLIGISVKARKVLTGTDCVVRALNSNKIHLVLLSSDASNNTKKKMFDKCTYYNINIDNTLSTDDLLKATGKDNLMVLGITDSMLALNIYNLLKEDIVNES